MSFRSQIERGEEITRQKHWQGDAARRAEAIKIHGQLEREFKRQRRRLQYPWRSSLYRRAVKTYNEIGLRLNITMVRQWHALRNACLSTKRDIQP